MIVIHATSRPQNVRGFWPIRLSKGFGAIDFQVMHNEHAPAMSLTDCLWFAPGSWEQELS